MKYEQFLAGKIVRAAKHGKQVEPADIHERLFDWQRKVVTWACERGRAALWLDTGLGKTTLQLEWARLLGERTLFIAPLAVASQTKREAETLGMDLAYCRSQEQADGAQFVITNYEMVDRFDPSQFGAVVLDESSILKNYSGKTKQALCDLFADTDYRLACTATPAPNDVIELGNHSEFLGVMPSHEMLTRWFINDSMSAGSYRLKGHAVESFWRWVCEWAVCATKPSDVGRFDDSAYVLPGLQIHEVMVEDKGKAEATEGCLFNLAKVNATSIWREKRRTTEDRCQAAADIVNAEPDESWIVWVDTNDESSKAAELIPDAVEVRGNDTVAAKESALLGFSDGAHRVLVTKSSIAGYGLNWQHCARVVFVGRTYSYEKLYQAIRRTHRFGQSRKVEVYLICTDGEDGVGHTIERKRQEHLRMQANMTDATKRFGLGSEGGQLGLTSADIEKREGTDWELYVGDCVEASRMIAPESVDLSVFSPPFSNLYVYSDRQADMGNCVDHEEFFAHFRYLVDELYRIVRNGRLVCVHCKDLPLFKGRDGAAGLYDFPADLSACFVDAGFTFQSRVTIWKDPVIESHRTNNSGLLHASFMKRRECVRMGMADYVLCFRKHVGDVPDRLVDHVPVPGDYIGEAPPTHWDDDRHWTIQLWQKYASPVWFDIRQTDVLDYQKARGEKDEKHICPLQLGVIERLVWLYSNPGDLVYSPFTGIGSEGHVALSRNRRFVGAELNPIYADVAERNLVAAKAQKTLFDA